jgi:hypothetical protein
MRFHFHSKLWGSVFRKLPISPSNPAFARGRQYLSVTVRPQTLDQVMTAESLPGSWIEVIS